MENYELNNDLILLPRVKSCVATGGAMSYTLPLVLMPSEDLTVVTKAAAESYGEFFTLDNTLSADRLRVNFLKRGGLGAEGYTMEIGESVYISYTEDDGAFYALMTLRQILLNGVLPCCGICDSPSMSLRGYMLDVSRGKIPTIESLKAIADTLAALKYNHLELYFEGSPFVYPGYEKYADKDAYTPEEIAEFDAYCKARKIELTPNLNSLGHMSYWLAIDRFKDLAEKKDGLEDMGLRFPPSTIDCNNPDAVNFVLSLIDGLTPCFESNRVNIGLDEPFELGKGNNARAAEVKGVGGLYADYVSRLHAELKTRGKGMIMWGDILARYPEISLPDDVTIYDWGYQAEYPFDARAAFLKRSGKNFALCPGTSSWLSIGGITDNMLENIHNAAKAARKYGALGIVLTDWGDGGHMQMPFVSYPAILTAAALSWSNECGEMYLKTALDKLIFKDEPCTVGGLILDIGRYSKFEERALECRTLASIPLQFPNAIKAKYDLIENGLMKMTLSMLPPDLVEIYRDKMSKRKEFILSDFNAYIDELHDRLSRLRLNCADADTLRDEIALTIDLISALERARLLLKNGEGSENLADELRRMSSEFKRLWLKRNRPSGVDIGVENLIKIAENLICLNR